MKLYRLERAIVQTGPMQGLSSVIASVCCHFSNFILLKPLISSRSSNMSYKIWKPIYVISQIHMVSSIVNNHGCIKEILYFHFHMALVAIP